MALATSLLNSVTHESISSVGADTKPNYAGFKMPVMDLKIR